jgi:putative flippase GtrA
MLLAMKEFGIPYGEVKIRTVYIEENKSSHFRTVQDSWRIYKLILAHFFRYTISSLASSVVDTLGYYLLGILLSGVLSGFALTAVSTGVARIVSSVINFFANQKLVFHSKVSTGTSLLRYFILAVVQMAAQMLMTYGAYELFHVAEDAHLLRTVIYVIVMCILFFASFIIQQRWVFAGRTDKKD